MRAVGLAQALLAAVWPGLTSGWLENAADGSVLDTASSKCCESMLYHNDRTS